VRGSVVWGDQHLNLHVGSAYDIVERRIRAFDNSQAWQNAVCGDNPSVFLPSPNTQPPCQGLDTPTPGAGYPTYPAYGTGFTAGQTGPITYAGSLIPMSELANFLKPGPDGFITVDWSAFKEASNYDQFHNSAPQAGAANTGANGGLVREKTWGVFGEVNGDWHLGDNELVFNAGVRWVKTWQSIGGRVSIPDTRNAHRGLSRDGQCQRRRLLPEHHQFRDPGPDLRQLPAFSERGAPRRIPHRPEGRGVADNDAPQSE
jgi:hypothetical protein